MSTSGSLDPRTPIIVGVGQHNDHGTGAEPAAMMIACTEAALTDAGSDSLRAMIDWVRVPWGVWPYADPGRLVAERIGAPDARTTKTTVGGNQVYDLLIDSAVKITAGQADVVVICGAETQRTRRADKAAGRRSPYLTETDGAAPDEVFGSTVPLATDAEDAAGLNAPINFYAMAESAQRHRLGHDVVAHQRFLGELWATGSNVASRNPHAWSRDPVSAHDIATASETNRAITAPYTKMLTSNLAVNQAGAFIMCSVEAALRAGIARDRWVFPWAGTTAGDTAFMTNRWAFDESPAMRIAGRRVLELAGVTVDDCAFIDLYSCFPVAVQVAMREIGVPTDREWTITGGLTFAAGPLNCYCLLPIVRAVELLREQPDERAFLTGNGGYFTKHSFVVLSGQPSDSGFATHHAAPGTTLQDRVDAEPTRPTPTPIDHNARPVDGTIDAYTVVYGRDGAPHHALVAVLDRDGRRHFLSDVNTDTMNALINSDRVGERWHP